MGKEVDLLIEHPPPPLPLLPAPGEEPYRPLPPSAWVRRKEH